MPRPLDIPRIVHAAEPSATFATQPKSLTERRLRMYPAKFLRSCAEQTPPQGLPGHDPVGRRYGRILEHFSVFLQKHCALVQRQYIHQCCLPAPPEAEPDDAAAAPEEGEAEAQEE